MWHVRRLTFLLYDWQLNGVRQAEHVHANCEGGRREEDERKQFPSWPFRSLSLYLHSALCLRGSQLSEMGEEEEEEEEE